jgi:hypothetical protein
MPKLKASLTIVVWEKGKQLKGMAPNFHFYPRSSHGLALNKIWEFRRHSKGIVRTYVIALRELDLPCLSDSLEPVLLNFVRRSWLFSKEVASTISGK